MPATALPPTNDLLTAANQAAAKTWFSSLRACLAWLLGEDGEVSTARAALGVPAAANPSTSGTFTHTGSADFSGSAKRFQGDFSNATFVSRLMFQTRTANSPTTVGAIPIGSGAAAGWASFNAADADNASYFYAGVSATLAEVTAGKTGSGSYLPMVFQTGGSERVRITPNGDVRPYYTNNSTVAAGATFTYNPATPHGQVCLITATGAGTVTFGAPSNITEGATYKLILKAGDTSARTLAFNAAFKFPSATPPLTSATTTNGGYDTFTFLGGAGNTLIYDGHTADAR